LDRVPQPDVMRASSSAGSLTLSKELGKPRSLVVPRGSERSWSTPALAAAFSLRKYAVSVAHIPGDRPIRSFAGDPLELPIEKIDLIGGNGKWRMLKAQEEFKRKEDEDRERRRQERIKAAEKTRRQVELADRRQKHQEEEERRWQEEREQKRRDQLERERVQREHQEKLRLEREEREEERRRRMPKTCETCDGSCKCQECMGKGYVFSIFLCSRVTDDDRNLGGTSMDHGRKHQGCDKCGGYSHNMLGELKKGTGECANCNGLGKIWPAQDPSWSQLEPVTSPKAKMQSHGYQMDRTGEVKVL